MEGKIIFCILSFVLLWNMALGRSYRYSNEDSSEDSRFDFQLPRAIPIRERDEHFFIRPHSGSHHYFNAPDRHAGRPNHHHKDSYDDCSRCGLGVPSQNKYDRIKSYPKVGHRLGEFKIRQPRVPSPTAFWNPAEHYEPINNY